MLKAIKENNIDEIKKLLKTSFRENPEDFRNGNDKMALINAVHHGNLEIVNLLLESNIDIHDNNDIALVIAVCSGHLEVFDAMIRRGFIHGDDYFYTDDERHLSVIYR
jgi:ankyrin repeat protein